MRLNRCILTLFVLPLTAPAQQISETPVTAIPQVEVKPNPASYDARRDDTATKIVVNQDEILKYGDNTLGDVLKRLPGVTVGGVPGRGGDIRLRGLGNGYTQILLNGEPGPPGFSLGTLTPEMVERIEIMRAATAEYSTQAIAGTINIVLKRAIVTAQRDLRLGLRADDGQPGASASFQSSDRAGIYAYAQSASVSYYKQQRSDHGVTTMTDPAGMATLRRDNVSSTDGVYKALNLAPRVNVNLGPMDAVTWQTFINVARYGGGWNEQSGTRFGPLPRFSAAGGDVQDDTTSLRTDLTWVHKMADEAKLEVKAGLNGTQHTNDQRSDNVGPGNIVALQRDVRSDATDRGLSASGKFTTRIVDGHTFSGGWDGAGTRRGEDRIQRESAPPGLPSVNFDQGFQATVSRTALFVQDEWTIDMHWSGYAGVRWEAIRTGSRADAVRVENTSRVWSPLFQALYKIPHFKNDQIRLALTRTYKAPQLANLIPRRINALDNTATTPDTQGNPALKPELASGLDVAYEHTLAAGGLLSASGYMRRISDNIRNNIVLVDGVWVSMPVNTGSARAHGIEFEARFGLRALVQGAPAIDVRANVTRNWSTLDSVPGPNNRLVSQTPVSATVGLDYQAGKLPLTLGGSFSFQNGGPVRFSANEFDYAGPKRTLDLYALIKLSAKNQLRLSVFNLLHEDYVTATTWVDRNGALSDTVFTPSAAVIQARLEIKL